MSKIYYFIIKKIIFICIIYILLIYFFSGYININYISFDLVKSRNLQEISSTNETTDSIYSTQCTNYTISNTNFSNLNESTKESTTIFINTLLNTLLKSNTSTTNTTTNDNIISASIPIIAPYIVFLVFIIISIISWIILIVCTCCQCLCCKSTKAESKAGCTFCSVLMNIIFLIVVIVFVIIGLIMMNGIKEKFTNSKCSLLKFSIEIQKGENKTTTPKWIGLNGIDSKIKGLISSLETIDNNKQAAFSGITNNRTVDADGYYQLLENSYVNSKFEVVSPNPNVNKPITPEFINRYGPRTVSNSQLFLFQKDFDMNILGLNMTIQALKDITYQITDNLLSIKNIFTSASKTIETIKESTSTLDNNIVIYYKNLVDNVTSIFTLVLIIIFSVLSVLSITLFLSSLLWVYKEIKAFKIISHFIWNLLILLTILVLIISVITGLISIIFSLASSFFSILFQAQNFSRLITSQNSQSGDIFNSCINGNGDISSIVFGKNSNQEGNSSIYSVENFYNQSSYLDGVSNSIINNKGSYSISLYQDYLKRLERNVGLDQGTDEYSGLYAMNSLNSMSDYKKNPDFQSKNKCNLNVYDLWTDMISSCPADYKYIDTSNPNDNFGEKSCLLISDWETTTIISKRYTPNSCSNTFISSFQSQLDSIKIYSKQVNDKLNEKIYPDLKKLNEFYYSQVSSTIDVFKSLRLVTQPMTEVISEVNGNSDFFGFINCQFMGRNIRFVMIAIDEIGNRLMFISLSLGVSAVASLFVIYFSLIGINRKTSYENYRRSLVYPVETIGNIK